MEFDLCPAVTLQTGSYNVVVAPPELILATLNTNKELQRFMFLYVSGNFSRILNGVTRTSGGFEVRRAFTAFQLVTILSESYHTIILVEHDPTLYDAEERNMLMTQVTRALKSAAQEAMVILYTPSPDRSFHTLAKQADRVFHLAPLPDSQPVGRTSLGRGRRAGTSPGPRLQTTLEAFINGTDDRKQPHRNKDPHGEMETGDLGITERGSEIRGTTGADDRGAKQRKLLCV